MRRSSVFRVGVGIGVLCACAAAVVAQRPWWSQLSDGAVPAWGPLVGVGLLALLTVGALQCEERGVVPAGPAAAFAALTLGVAVSLVVEGRSWAAWVQSVPVSVRDTRGVSVLVSPPVALCAGTLTVEEQGEWRAARLTVAPLAPQPVWWALLGCEPQQLSQVLVARGLRL